MSGWFDLTEQGIVEVGLDAKIVGDANNVAPVAVEADVEHYAEEQLAHTAGALAVATAKAA